MYFTRVRGSTTIASAGAGPCPKNNTLPSSVRNELNEGDVQDSLRSAAQSAPAPPKTCACGLLERPTWVAAKSQASFKLPSSTVLSQTAAAQA
jgi:hypothetical protein